MKKWLGKSLIVILLFFMGSSFADNPVTMLQGVADKMVKELSANQDKLQKDPSVVRHIVETVLVPYIDAQRMSGMVVGRNNWYSATPEQRHQFVDEFKQVVIATYSDALASFDDDKVMVYPLRKNVEGQKYAQVKSAIIRKSGQKIVINYNLIASGNSWKIYDFSIEGVSIVQNYRAQFASTLASGGMTKLLTQLEQYNKER